MSNLRLRTEALKRGVLNFEETVDRTSRWHMATTEGTPIGQEGQCYSGLLLLSALYPAQVAGIPFLTISSHFGPSSSRAENESAYPSSPGLTI